MLRNFLRSAIMLVVTTVAFYSAYRAGTQPQPYAPPEGSDGFGAAEQVLARAYDERQSGLQISGSGAVVRLLSDDTRGSRHQRFIIELASGQRLLVAHNIDLAPRVGGLRVGDRVEFNGEYEWNSQGGLIHWTHKDPAGSHPDGWLRHRGRVYD